MRTRIAILIAVTAIAVGACTNEYHAEPVVGPDDPRSVDMPEHDDAEGRADQDCFMIVYHNDGWDIDHDDEGIACMIEDEDDR